MTQPQMRQMISFNPADYKNTFPGEIAISRVGFIDNVPNAQAWMLGVIWMMKNDNGEWVYQPGQCNIQNCEMPEAKKATRHRHWTLWADSRENSAIHQTIISIRENGKFLIDSEAGLLGRRFIWREITRPPYTRRSDGIEVRPSPYYIVESEFGIEPIHEEPVATTEALPFDAPISATAPEPPVAPVNTNGTATPALSAHDKMILIVGMVDGKNDDDSVSALRGLLNSPDFASETQLRLKVIQRKWMEDPMTEGLLSKDDLGIYHATEKAMGTI